uniref:Uncharacterized protein n=1 Tax=Arundo donax TaxID=35708 RepID=A0A0A9EAG6_ARUDO
MVWIHPKQQNIVPLLGHLQLVPIKNDPE